MSKDREAWSFSQVGDPNVWLRDDEGKEVIDMDLSANMRRKISAYSELAAESYRNSQQKKGNVWKELQRGYFQLRARHMEIDEAILPIYRVNFLEDDMI